MKALQRLALPVVDGALCPHFGRAREFLLCDVEPGTRVPGRMRVVIKPAKPGECESVPDWLAAMAVTTVLAGGVGAVAQQRLQSLRLRVITGLPAGEAEQVVRDWLTGEHTASANPCEPGRHLIRHCRKPRS